MAQPDNGRLLPGADDPHKWKACLVCKAIIVRPVVDMPPGICLSCAQPVHAWLQQVGYEFIPIAAVAEITIRLGKQVAAIERLALAIPDDVVARIKKETIDLNLSVNVSPGEPA